jgi:hypothetical protein
MPREAVEHGGVDYSIPLNEIAPALLQAASSTPLHTKSGGLRKRLTVPASVG